jgi:squid-like protein
MSDPMETEGGATSNPIDEDDRKLFAGGLPQEATEDDIREHFGQYGDIESVNLKTVSYYGD